MNFEITIDTGAASFKMKVERLYASDSIERFKVSGGNRSIVLQSNRPEAIRSTPKKRIRWKILEGEFKGGDPDEAALALQRVFRKIEEHMAGSEV